MAVRGFHIESAPLSRECALPNFAIRDTKNVTSYELGLGNERGKLCLNLSKSGAYISVVAPDEGAAWDTITTEVQIIDVFVSDKNIEHDRVFLRVEAAGYAVEIVSGTNIASMLGLSGISAWKGGRFPCL